MPSAGIRPLAILPQPLRNLPSNHVPTLSSLARPPHVSPLFARGYTHSPLFGSDQAPARGYFRRYVLRGNEAGFFVRTRDGRHYGKYVLASADSRFLAGSPDLQEPACT